MAELGRGGIQTFSSLPLPEAIGAEARGAIGSRPLGVGGWGMCANMKAVFQPLGAPPSLNVFVWITRRGILVLSNNGPRFIRDLCD